MTLTPEVRAPDAFKETEIGLVPVEWDVVPLGEVAELNLGRTPRRKEVEKYWTNGVIPWVSISDLNNGYVRITEEEVSQRAFTEVFKERIVPRGSLLLSFKLTIGKVGILDIDAVHNEAIVSFVLDDSVDRDFLFFLFRHIDYDAYLDTYVKGKTLSKRKLIVFPIPLPPLPEQRRIAQVLDTIQRAITAQDDLIAAARELKHSLMQRLFTYGPGSEPAPTKETEIGEVPEHWDVVRLRNLTEKPQYGFTQSARDEPIGPRFLRITDITNWGVNWAMVPYCECPPDQIEKYRLFPGDILFARTGATTGKSFLVKDCPEAVFASYLIRVRTKEQVLPDYLYHYFNSSFYWKQINRSKAGSAQAGVNATRLSNLLVPVASSDEQQQIVQVLAATDHKIATEQDRKTALQTLFKSMLHQLMTGQMRVGNIDVE